MSDNRVGAYILCYDNNTWVNPQCHGSTGFVGVLPQKVREIRDASFMGTSMVKTIY